MTTKAQFDRAYMLGNASIGKKATDNPYRFDHGTDAEVLFEQWESGRQDAITRRREESIASATSREDLQRYVTQLVGAADAA